MREHYFFLHLIGLVFFFLGVGVNLGEMVWQYEIRMMNMELCIMIDDLCLLLTKLMLLVCDHS